MIGAIVSILLKIILAIFIVYEFYVIFSRKHPAVSVKHVLNDFSKDPSANTFALNPMSRGFDIAIGFLVRNINSNNTQSS